MYKSGGPFLGGLPPVAPSVSRVCWGVSLTCLNHTLTRVLNTSFETSVIPSTQKIATKNIFLLLFSQDEAPSSCRFFSGVSIWINSRYVLCKSFTAQDGEAQTWRSHITVQSQCGPCPTKDFRVITPVVQKHTPPLLPTSTSPSPPTKGTKSEKSIPPSQPHRPPPPLPLLCSATPTPLTANRTLADFPAVFF